MVGRKQDHRDEGWLILRRGELTLKFLAYADLDPTTSSFMCSIRVDNVGKLVRIA